MFGVDCIRILDNRISHEAADLFAEFYQGVFNLAALDFFFFIAAGFVGRETQARALTAPELARFLISVGRGRKQSGN